MTSPVSVADPRRTKIVCTLGPATDAPGMLERLVSAGLDVARFNFSHGEHAHHKARLEQLRALAAKVRRPLTALADLQGPKIRTGRFAVSPVQLVAGARFTITARDVPGDTTIVSTTWRELPRHVMAGDSLLLCDGMIRLACDAVDGEDIHCRVEQGGELSDNKGINLPGTTARGVALTEKDRFDMRFILEHGFDVVALSFVTSAADVQELRKLMEGHPNPPAIVAKIEKPAAVANIDEIYGVVDGIMVARGDLGVELAAEKVPSIQKRLIRGCVDRGIPVITATEMLETMTYNPRPTRAEASDVANAIEDGTDAVMLSGETARGKFPAEAVSMMARIAREVDPSLSATGAARFAPTGLSVDEAVAHAAAQVAQTIGASLIVAYTESGSTARRIAKYRPSTPMVAISPYGWVCRRLTLTWGVTAIEGPSVGSLDDLPARVDALCAEHGLARPGELVVITAGAPLHITGTTNTLRVHRVSETSS
jgi:pyruvate kinase